MLRTSSVTATLASLLLLAPANAAIYTRNSPVLQVNHKSYDKLIANSNYTSIVEFYAPWCGHCQNLKPAYEKSATSLKGLAKVAAINCDEESNKAFCGSMGVQGFPTLKIVKPGKKSGRPIVEDYQGPRTAKDITDAVVSKIKNHVKRLQDADVEPWLKEDNSTAKAILFSEKAAVSALLKAVAIDFLGSIKIGQIRSNQKKQLEYFGLDEQIPKLLLLPGGDKNGILYDGVLKKEGIVEFLSQAASPNPDPAPAKAKSPFKDAKSKVSKAKESKKVSTKSAKASSSLSKASASQASSEATSAAASAAKETIVDSDPLESPGPEVETDKPIKLPVPPQATELKALDKGSELQDECLTKKSPICFLILLPKEDSADGVLALRSLAAIRQKHEERSGKAAIHAYAVPNGNKFGSQLRSKPVEKVEVIVLNGKREWIKRYSGESFEHVPLETWVDSVKMGEGKKEKLSSEIEKQILNAPRAPVAVEDAPAGIRSDGPSSGQSDDDSGLKVEVVEEVDDHDEL